MHETQSHAFASSTASPRPKTWVPSALGLCPLQSSHHLSPIRPSGRIRLPGVFGTLQRHSRSRPMWSGLSKPTPAPLAGFLNLSAAYATIEFHGLVSCRNRSWATSLQSVPLAGVVFLSRGHWLPRSHPRALVSAPSAALSPSVSRLPRRSALVFPPLAMGSLSTSKLASRSPWAADSGIAPSNPPHLPRSFLPPASPFAPSSSCPGPSGRCSPGFPPL